MTIDSLLERPQAQPAPPLPKAGLAERMVGRLAELERTGWVVAAAVTALTVISLLVRIRALNFHFWVDEGISVGVASHPLSQLPHLLREDGSPPLYYLILHVWMQLFGRGEVATHVLSLIPAVLAVPAAFWCGASLFGRRVGLICAVLVSTVPFLTSYAQETRMYSLLALLSLLVAASFVHVFVYGRRRWLPVLVISLAASLYTHNWALFLGVSCFAAYLGCLYAMPERRRELLRDGAIAFGLVALAYLPWLPTLLYQAKHTGAPWALKPNIWSLTQGLYFIVGGRGAAVALLLAGGSGLLAARRDAAPGSAIRTSLVSLLLLGLLTLLLAWAEAKINPSWAPRYEAAIVGPLALVFAVGLARGGKLGLVGLALVCCFWVLDPVPSSINAKSTVAPAAGAVRAELGANALVLSTQPEQVPTLAYYLPKVEHYGTPLGAVTDPGVVDWRGALEKFRRSSPRSVLAPMLRSLTPGERVALVIPTRMPSEPLYMKLINRSSHAWYRYLTQDPKLRLLRIAKPHAAATGVPVEIFVYEQR
jgi:hypothetical protein